MSNQPRRRGPMGGGHGRMGTGEKAKDFKGTMKKLFTYRRSICMKMISSLINSISECYIKRYLSYSLPNGSCNTISSPFYISCSISDSLI